MSENEAVRVLREQLATSERNRDGERRALADLELKSESARLAIESQRRNLANAERRVIELSAALTGLEYELERAENA